MDPVPHIHTNCEVVHIQLKMEKQGFECTAYKCEKITLDTIRNFLFERGIYNFEVFNKSGRALIPNCDLRDLISEEFDDFHVKQKIFVLNLLVHIDTPHHEVFSQLTKQHENCLDERNQPTKKYKVVFQHKNDYHLQLCPCQFAPTVKEMVDILRTLPEFAGSVIKISNNLTPFPLPGNILLSSYIKRSSLDGVNKFSITVDSTSSIEP